MTKTELIDALAAESGLKKSEVEKVLGAFTKTVAETLKKGENITLVGFGSFGISERKARTGRNPQTGKEIKIPARKSPKFTPGKGLKDAVA